MIKDVEKMLRRDFGDALCKVQGSIVPGSQTLIMPVLTQAARLLSPIL